LKQYKSEIDAGHPVIFSGTKWSSGDRGTGSSPFTSAGHFVVSQGYISDSSGNIKGIIINDPANKSGVYENLAAMKQDTKKAFAFTLSDKSKAPTPSSGDSPFPSCQTVKGAWATGTASTSTDSSNSGTTSTKKASEWFTSLEGFNNVSSGYGPRNIGNGNEFHNGIDIAAAKNAKIRTPIGGTIELYRTEAQSNGYGNEAVLKDAKGMYHWFCHMTSSAVKQGDTVKANDIIGYVGSTGQSTGNHLHYTISSQPKGNHSTGGDIDPDTYSYTSAASGTGKKNNIVTAGMGVKKAIYGLGKLTPEQALNIDTTATEPSGSDSITPYSSLSSQDKKVVNEYDKMPGHKNYNASSFNHINSSPTAVGGSTYDGIDYTGLLNMVISLLQQITNNTSQLSNLTTIIDLLSQQFDIAVATSSEDTDKISKLNQIKKKLKEIQGRSATTNQGSSTGFGNSLMNQDMEYLMTAMSSIATT
jgi:murein DD-endopeptidase MepM/ murein hydrolase activator NlpD